jgi:hypothetical protein
MNTFRNVLLASLACSPSASLAQPFVVTNFSLTCGGNTTPVVAGPYTLVSTVGDPMAAPPQSAGAYSIGTGFLFTSTTGGSTCYPNCDGSTQVPVLNVQDFTCFLQKYSAGDAYANCDGSVQQPALNVQDFTCFLQKYSAGCP